MPRECRHLVVFGTIHEAAKATLQWVHPTDVQDVRDGDMIRAPPDLCMQGMSCAPAGSLCAEFSGSPPCTFDRPAAGRTSIALQIAIWYVKRRVLYIEFFSHLDATADVQHV